MLKDYANKKGLTSEDLFNAKGVVLMDGVIYGNTKDDWFIKAYDVIYKRIYYYSRAGITQAIFMPVFNLYDEFAGFVVRKMHPKDKQDSHFMDGYKKRNILYNLNKAYGSVMANDKVYVVEGTFDCLRLVKAGLVNTVSVLGTSLSQSHIVLLRQFTNNICLCLDGDAAGLDAMSKIYNEYRNQFNFSVIVVPEDPDEYVNKYGLQEFVSKEIPYVKFTDNLIKQRIQ